MAGRNPCHFYARGRAGRYRIILARTKLAFFPRRQPRRLCDLFAVSARVSASPHEDAEAFQFEPGYAIVADEADCLFVFRFLHDGGRLPVGKWGCTASNCLRKNDAGCA